ncbi:hypothetical protein [Fredinandcohnia sp. 179-A 10B2 NHS]|uniref:hypothetical protein n=1 Tax=Fredinandcohnia sp. 179-A 10B2 NHS TaxID=3235176 RepID=UPI0039A2FC48
MKKVLLFMLFLLLFAASAVQAAEEPQYFGVGATVTKLKDGIYSVKTEGNKENEGFVFTPKDIKGGETYIFSVELQGATAIYLNVDETDPRGTFLAETVSPVISIHDVWRTVQLEVELQDSTSQIDAMVLTNKQEATEFKFRNVKVTKKEETDAPE